VRLRRRAILRHCGAMAHTPVQPLTRSTPLGPSPVSLYLRFSASGRTPAVAQTPSPLQEWQYSSGVLLHKLYEPVMPDWQVQSGLAFESRPLYLGVTYRKWRPGRQVSYRISTSSRPAKASVQLPAGAKYRAGISLATTSAVTPTRTSTPEGSRNVSAAPWPSCSFYIISKAIPLTLRVDLRQYVAVRTASRRRGSVYAAPGSSERFVMFAGPSFTFAIDCTCRLCSGQHRPVAASGIRLPDAQRRGVADSASAPPGFWAAIAVASRPRRQSAARLRRPEPITQRPAEYRRAGRRL